MWSANSKRELKGGRLQPFCARIFFATIKILGGKNFGGSLCNEINLDRERMDKKPNQSVLAGSATQAKSVLQESRTYAYPVIKRAVLTKIAEVYPEYAQECNEQKKVVW